MKRLIKSLTLPLVILFFISCDQQTADDEEFRESLSEVKQEMQDASELLEEAIDAENSSDLIVKSDEALNTIEEQLDVYMNAMDKALRRIDKDTRTSIIDMKQKIAEIDFRLALLESNKQLRMSEQAEGVDEIPEVRRTRPVGYRFPHILNMDDEIYSERVQYGEEVMEEVKTNLQELNDELNQFIEENL
ncbi:MAG: hypothetical protein ABR597_09265 [Bacteroidales bacterium]